MQASFHKLPDLGVMHIYSIAFPLSALRAVTVSACQRWVGSVDIGMPLLIQSLPVSMCSAVRRTLVFISDDHFIYI